MKPSNKPLIGLLLLFQAACTTLSPEPQVLQSRPDPAWTAEVPEPQLLGRTNADLASWAKALREALAIANAQLRAIREWAAP